MAQVVNEPPRSVATIRTTMFIYSAKRTDRHGGIYIVVLGTSLIVAVLGLAAMVAQRLYNRMLTASADVRQAQLNACTAVELAMLTTSENNDWRTQLDGSSYLFTNRSIGTSSSCSARITDAPADPATAPADLPIKVLGIGHHGATIGEAARTTAEQHLEMTIDPRRQPHDCLKNGNATAPNWNTIFQYYQSIGTAIDINSLGPPELARNGDISSPTLSPYWTGAVAGIADGASLFWVDSGGLQYLWVHGREGVDAGAAQLVSPLVKPNKTYTATVRVYNTSNPADKFRLSFYANPSSGTAPVTRGSWSSYINYLNGWVTISVQFTAPNWTDAELANAIVIVQTGDYTNDIYVDDLSITENTTEKYIYRKVLTPSINPYGTVNANGVYYVDCGGTNTLVVERSRIVGTLLVIDPAANSRIGDGPIHWSPATPGYPILLVNGNFAIEPKSVDLSESSNAVNFNPAGAPYYSSTPSTDSATDDTYPLAEAVRGLVVVSGNLTYQNSPQIAGRVIVGGTTSGSPTFAYRPDALLNPPPPLGGFYTYRYDRRPASTRKAVQ